MMPSWSAAYRRHGRAVQTFLLRRLGNRPFWLVAGGILVFAAGSSTIGMADRDIACRSVAAGKDPETTHVADIMTRNVSTCYDDDLLSDAAHVMERKHVRRLPVLTHDGDLVGMLWWYLGQRTLFAGGSLLSTLESLLPFLNFSAAFGCHGANVLCNAP